MKRPMQDDRAGVPASWLILGLVALALAAWLVSCEGSHDRPTPEPTTDASLPRCTAGVLPCVFVRDEVCPEGWHACWFGADYAVMSPAGMTQLPACATEDSVYCVWDGATRGNLYYGTRWPLIVNGGHDS